MEHPKPHRLPGRRCTTARPSFGSEAYEAADPIEPCTGLSQAGVDDRCGMPGNVWRADRCPRVLRDNVAVQARRPQGPWPGCASSEAAPSTGSQRACLLRRPLRVRDSQGWREEAEPSTLGGPSGPPMTLDSPEPSTRRNGERFWTVPSRPCHSVVGRRRFRTRGERESHHIRVHGLWLRPGSGARERTRKALRGPAARGKSPAWP
jgi:hypothetical protein